MGRTESNWTDKALLALCVISTLAPLCFRHVLTLDGPLHVQHAAMLGHRLFGEAPGGHGVHVALEGIWPRATDMVALPILKLFGPAMAERGLVVVSALLLLLACHAWMRTTGVTSYLFALMPSLCLGQLLVLGFFGFLWGVALVLLAWARWITWRRIGGNFPMAFVLCSALALWSHRSALQLLLLMVATQEGIQFVRSRHVWKGALLLLIGAITAVGTLLAVVHTVPLEPVRAVEPWRDLWQLRPLLLMDGMAERPLLLAYGALLLGAIALAARARWRSAWNASDALLPLAALLLIGSLAVRTPMADLLYLADRAQWLALLLLALWCAVNVPRSRIALALAAFALIVHAGRMLLLERRMAPFAEYHHDLMRAVQQLPERGVVAVAHRGDDWILHNAGAHVSTVYNGMLLDKRGGLWYTRGTPEAERLRELIGGRMCEGYWLRHMERDPEERFVDAVLVIGPAEAVGDSCAIAFQPVLDRAMRTTFANGNASVHVWR
ncbi:MAG: hypothetical protein KA175_12100 [Flavobacteriales bacterium]|nr:hypothetical protein [Flavobacteriales bacterium]MBP6698355.1 hypothetical protein [Flavobacteriales bacterium]